MAVTDYPKQDYRQVEDLLYELLKRIPADYSDWKSEATGFPDPTDPLNREAILSLALGDDGREDVGMALLRMVARMGEVVIEQMNRVPQKNFLTFLDFMGIDPFPPKPARVALSFVLADGAKQASIVPKGTGVGVIDVDDVVFETEADIMVSRSGIKRLVSLHPASDQWTDHKLMTNGTVIGDAMIFHGDPAEQRIEHTLWFGHPELLNLTETTKLTVQMRFSSSINPFEDFMQTLRWETSPEWVMKQPETERSGNNISFVFPRLEPIEASEVMAVDVKGRTQGFTNSWLRVRTSQAVNDDLPLVQSVHFNISRSSMSVLLPDLAFANGTPLDLSKDFFPFGERPKFNNTFYLANEEIFSITGADIEIGIILSESFSPDTIDLTLNWEYWNGASWTLLGKSQIDSLGATTKDATNNFVDGTNALKITGDVTFNCPTMVKTTVNDEENYWLRVRITAGNYGKDAGLFLHPDSEDKPPEELTLADYIYTPDSYIPPSIASVTITTNNKISVIPEISLRSTASVFSDLTDIRSFALAERLEQTSPCLFVGLKEQEIVNAGADNLYFQLQPRLFAEERPRVVSDETHSSTLVIWEYWNGSHWLRLPLEDETENLSRPGLISFDRPTDMDKTYLFGDDLKWIRGSFIRGSSFSPKLGGIFPNTVWSTQATSIKKAENLGSSNGEPDQVFRLSKFPVLDGEIIEIREPVVPVGLKDVREVKDNTGKTIEIWVQWRPVGRFNQSGSSDRHYIIDRTEGKIVFGDGINGLIPPPGKANVQASSYRSGGGRIGNRPRGTITVLKTTFPSVDSVINHDAAFGGIDQEVLDQVMIRGPHSIKNRGRAVTVEDFEWLARQVSGHIARSLCLSNVRLSPGNVLVKTPGWVLLVIVPDVLGDRPMPSEIMLSDVKKFITGKCLLSLADRLDVIGPQYIEFDIDISLVGKEDVEEKLLQQRVNTSIRDFLHPLHGGQDCGGWQFGQRISLTEIMRIARETEDVDRIITAGLRLENERVTEISMPVSGLPYPSRINIMIEGR